MADTIQISVVIPSGFQFQPIQPGQPVQLSQPYLVLMSATSKVSITGNTSQTFNFGAGGVRTGYRCDDSAQISINSNAAIDLQFSVCNNTGGAASYLLTGVTLKDLASNAPAGSVFPSVEINFTGGTGGTLTLADQPKANAPGPLSYELWLLMVDGNANLGVIDPKIVNQL